MLQIQITSPGGWGYYNKCGQQYRKSQPKHRITGIYPKKLWKSLGKI